MRAVAVALWAPLAIATWSNPVRSAELDCGAALRIAQLNRLAGGPPFERIQRDWVQTPEHRYCNYVRKDETSSNVAVNVTRDAKGKIWPFTRDRFLQPGGKKVSGELLPGVGEEAVLWTDAEYPYRGVVLIGASAKANGHIYELMLRMRDGDAAGKRAYLTDTLEHLVESVR